MQGGSTGASAIRELPSIGGDDNTVGVSHKVGSEVRDNEVLSLME